jgi:hypothetical protein
VIGENQIFISLIDESHLFVIVLRTWGAAYRSCPEHKAD